MQTNTLWPKMAGEVSKMDEEWHALEIGRNGWELVTVVRTPSGTLTAFFKRIMTEESAPEERRTGVSALPSTPPEERRTGVSALPSTPKKKGRL